MPSEAAPSSPQDMAAGQQKADEQAAQNKDWNYRKQQMYADPEVQQFQQQIQVLETQKVTLVGKFGDVFNSIIDSLNIGNLFGGGNGKVDAALPCPFLKEGDAATFNADAEIPQGSFVSFVSGLSVVSVQAQISSKQAAAAVPAGVSGQTYVFVTNKEISDNMLSADSILFGPAILEGML